VAALGSARASKARSPRTQNSERWLTIQSGTEIAVDLTLPRRRKAGPQTVRRHLLQGGFPEFWFGGATRFMRFADAGDHHQSFPIRGGNRATISEKPAVVKNYDSRFALLPTSTTRNAFDANRKFSIVGHDWACWVGGGSPNGIRIDLQRTRCSETRPHPAIWRTGDGSRPRTQRRLSDTCDAAALGDAGNDYPHAILKASKSRRGIQSADVGRRTRLLSRSLEAARCI